MNLHDYIEYLNSNDLILESEEFTDAEWAHLGKHVELTGDANKRSGRNNPIYKDDQRYNDYQGLKWLDVKKHDEYTITSAFVDGAIDAIRTGESEAEYEGDSEYLNELTNAYRAAKNTEDLRNIIYTLLDNSDIYFSVLSFLKRFMHGHTTVYRGFEFTDQEYAKLTSNIDVRRVSSILQVINNKTKQFNSFSTSPMMAASFSNGHSGHRSVVIAAEVEPNDINFAFTAYLMGRHDGVGESELNINNLKDLHNLRVVTDLEREYKIAVSKLPTIESLQKELETRGEKVFDRTVQVYSFEQKMYIIGNIDGFSVLLDMNGHILTDYFVGHIDNICDDYVSIPCVNRRGYYRLYKFNKGYVTEEYRSMDCSRSTESGTVIIKFDDSKYQLFNLKTGRYLYKTPMKMISTVAHRFPRTWFKVITANGKQTIVDTRGGTAFIGRINMFDSIEYKYGTTDFKCTIGNETKIYKLSLKNYKLIEVLG